MERIRCNQIIVYIGVRPYVDGACELMLLP